MTCAPAASSRSTRAGSKPPAARLRTIPPMMRKTGMPLRRLGREAHSRARVLLQHKAGHADSRIASRSFVGVLTLGCRISGIRANSRHKADRFLLVAGLPPFTELLGDLVVGDGSAGSWATRDLGELYLRTIPGGNNRSVEQRLFSGPGRCSTEVSNPSTGFRRGPAGGTSCERDLLTLKWRIGLTSSL